MSFSASPRKSVMMKALKVVGVLPKPPLPVPTDAWKPHGFNAVKEAIDKALDEMDSQRITGEPPNSFADAIKRYVGQAIETAKAVDATVTEIVGEKKIGKLLEIGRYTYGITPESLGYKPPPIRRAIGYLREMV